MAFSTYPGFRWMMPLVAATLLAGCQSSRSAFQFTPVAPCAGTGQPVATPAAPTPAATPAVAAAASRQLPALPASVRRVVTQLTRLPKPVRASQPIETVVPVASGLPATAETAATPRSHQSRPAPAHITESGLGRIALFFLAILLGVLAGLGALVSLIPGVSFFGGVGLAAAGLVVLFLLYSLLSGGKKKKK